jgi:hypothetical protein
MNPRYKEGDKFRVVPECVMRVVKIVPFPERIGYELVPDTKADAEMYPFPKMHLFEGELATCEPVTLESVQ